MTGAKLMVGKNKADAKKPALAHRPTWKNPYLCD
jgi:hypothetical protein